MKGLFISLTGSFGSVRFLTLPVGPLEANCYVLWTDPDQAVVIDPGDEGPRIVSALQSKGLHAALVLNTHGHFDHIGAVEDLRRAFGATYRVHSEEVAVMQMVPAGVRLFGAVTPVPPAATEFVAHGERLQVGGLELVAIHTPGHTPGGMCFHVPREKAVFTGDTLFLGSIGRSDFPGGNGPLLIRSIRERLLTLPPETHVYPGHGPPSTIGDEAEANPFLA